MIGIRPKKQIRTIEACGKKVTLKELQELTRVAYDKGYIFVPTAILHKEIERLTPMRLTVLVNMLLGKSANKSGGWS